MRNETGELSSLVRPLFDGPIDIVGDVHGEYDALDLLLAELGYDRQGHHAEGRRLVFVGDLTDRGPDSPAVVDWVTDLIAAGNAQAVLGNHELNILLHRKREGNAWFFGQEEELGHPSRLVPQRLADDEIRQRALALFRSLPIVLERADLTVVHACGEAAAIEYLREKTDAALTFKESEDHLHRELAALSYDDVERQLALQNGNPVRVLTSGPEKHAEPFVAGGKQRKQARSPWWEDYDGERWLIFGHYWRQRVAGEPAFKHLFDDALLYAALGKSRRAMCIDYSVGKRFLERDGSGKPHQTRLAALRWPERMLYFDNAAPVALAVD